jgi:hypothetical protein
MSLPRCLPLTFFLSLCACASAPRGSATTSWGSTMSEVGRRFELIGLATHAGRLELAAYELGEIDELFTDTLPGASLPKEGHPEVLGSLRTTFATQGLGELKRALAAGQQAKALEAFGATARECNACHLASGHVFIEVPLVAGERVPRVDRPAAP